MHILVFNLKWMALNIGLAFVAVIFAHLLHKTSKTVLKLIYGIIWLIFLPNTLYMFTDMINIFRQWGRVGIFEKSLLLLQYAMLALIGLVTFILALYPFQKLLLRFFKTKDRRIVSIVIILLNFLVGFGIVLGRTERVNSWEIFTTPELVFQAMLHVLQTPNLIMLSALFGLLANFSYFLLRKPVMKYFNI